MIRSFADRDAEALFRGRFVRRIGADLQRVAQRKLRQLHATEALRDLAASPGYRLEQVNGDRSGRHITQINDRWRICFAWTDSGPQDVEIVEDHRG
jgi:toxin HigB-1